MLGVEITEIALIDNIYTIKTKNNGSFETKFIISSGEYIDVLPIKIPIKRYNFI